MIRVPRGSVYVLVFQTFRLSFFAISSAIASDSSSCPDGRRHHHRNGYRCFGRGDTRRHSHHRKPGQRALADCQDGRGGPISFHQSAVQPLSPRCARAPGFSPFTADVQVRSSVAVTPIIKLQVGGASTTVTVTGDDLVENDTSLHTDIDRNLIEKLPLESSSSSVSSLVTLSTPGVAADSNGLFHGLGDHASNSFSVDGQPITDQQSKVFSNQIPSNSIQSIQVIAGAPPAEYGDKTSLVIQVTTRSGQGLTKPTGSISSSYGSFGSATGGVRYWLWFANVGQLLRARWIEYRPLSGYSGVCGLPRQRKRTECL